ncbi:hypothetical protein GCM10010912_69910 [Paenibacillus albidus]|uniref:Uncharacterized protein n=1 Tax=Paenibacillus albidus TaxID=2041023 RepID=A0A917FZV8_9BACL|nr:hypothetical protein [Paenibacillus albidus]GGG15466.1 hypothetical protein GCM10010912_69910 [Paenibacillus albidus]
MPHEPEIEVVFEGGKNKSYPIQGGKRHWRRVIGKDEVIYEDNIISPELWEAANTSIKNRNGLPSAISDDRSHIAFMQYGFLPL